MPEAEKLRKESGVKLNQGLEKRPSRPVDLVHLARQTLGDVELETEILIMFRDISISYLQKLQHPDAENDFALNVHALKGAALGIGATQIAQQALSVEAELRVNGQASAEAMSDLAIAVEETNVFITQLLER